MEYNKLIFELSVDGRKAYSLPDLDVPSQGLENILPQEALAEDDLDFPQVSELDVVRHYTNLSNKNYNIDKGFYPLGSCTMKYNPKINEKMVNLAGFSNIHPLQREESVQGALRLMYELDEALCEIAGMDKMSLNPAAGAHGEYSGVSIIKAYHEKNGDMKRDKVIVPDSAHGTNPATAVMAGCELVEVRSNSQGLVDVDALKELVGDDTCALMLTNPNTLGLFEHEIKEITDTVHEAGGLVYYDGANANAILGKVKPGDMGFDVIHFNLHKTFSTPHGGGGPGAGPIGVKDFLRDFLPKPRVEKDGDIYYLDNEYEDSIGRVKDFQGHFAVLVRAYSYILSLGSDGLNRVSDVSVLNANYIQESLKDLYDLAYDRHCMHECVFAGLKDDDDGVITTNDVAKAIIDRGFHPPTVYFPMIVDEALMIEPTETENKETLDAFIQAMRDIAQLAKEDPDKVKVAPTRTSVQRPDETQAARNPILTYQIYQE